MSFGKIVLSVILPALHYCIAWCGRTSDSRFLFLLILIRTRVEQLSWILTIWPCRVNQILETNHLGWGTFTTPIYPLIEYYATFVGTTVPVFGCKDVVFEGDFRQILHVISIGRSDVSFVASKSSMICLVWSNVWHAHVSRFNKWLLDMDYQLMKMHAFIPFDMHAFTLLHNFRLLEFIYFDPVHFDLQHLYIANTKLIWIL